MGKDADQSQVTWWSRPQRIVLAGLMLALAGLMLVRYVRNPVYVSDPQPQRPPRYDQLLDRIDPNTADWETLAALPGVGEKRAREIVRYREEFQLRDPSRPAFARREDLLRINGIGVATMEALEPYLLFPGAAGPKSEPDPLQRRDGQGDP